MHKVIVNYIPILIGLLFSSSCTLLKPLPLAPFNNANTLSGTEMSDLTKLNGNYDILSVDSSFCTLEYALLYSDLSSSKQSMGQKAYINLEALDRERIRAKFFLDSQIVRETTIHGRRINNYFEFHTTRLKFRFVINVYRQQTNRFALSKNGDLYLDTNRGGIGFLLFLPIPLSGSSYDTYNLMFIRKK